MNYVVVRGSAPRMLCEVCGMMVRLPASSMKSVPVSCIRQSSGLAAWNVQHRCSISFNPVIDAHVYMENAIFANKYELE